MKYILFFLMVTLMNSMTAQEQLPENSIRFLQQILQIGDKNELNGGKLSSKELMQTIRKYDFSSVWQQRNNAILGFIGKDNYQRLQIKFISIVKNPIDSTKYYVYGKSKVKTNICPFIGEIKLLNIRKVEIDKDSKQVLFTEYKDEVEKAKRFLAPEYVLLAQYSFFEDPKVKNSGRFDGILKTNFYIYEDTVYYNDLRSEMSDYYNNNQYVGIWTNYATGKSKICNWGEFRIPNAGNLDIGAGEFRPNPVYNPYGWESYIKTNKEEEWWK